MFINKNIDGFPSLGKFPSGCRSLQADNQKGGFKMKLFFISATMFGLFLGIFWSLANSIADLIETGPEWTGPAARIAGIVVVLTAVAILSSGRPETNFSAGIFVGMIGQVSLNASFDIEPFTTLVAVPCASLGLTIMVAIAIARGSETKSAAIETPSEQPV